MIQCFDDAVEEKHGVDFIHLTYGLLFTNLINLEWIVLPLKLLDSIHGI